MQRVLAIVIFFFLLFNSSLSFADEGQGESHNDPSTQTSADEESSHASHEEETDANLDLEDNQQKEGNQVVENNHGSEHSDQVVEEDSHSTEEGEHGAEGGHGSEEITESDPNYLVLSIFGLINLTFILIGIWNKWIRRRVNKNVFAK